MDSPSFVDLSGGVYEKLKSLDSAEDMLKATLKNGEKLIQDQKIRDDTDKISHICDILKNLIDFKQRCSEQSQSKTNANNISKNILDSLETVSRALDIYSSLKQDFDRIRQSQDFQQIEQEFNKIIAKIHEILKNNKEYWKEYHGIIDGCINLTKTMMKFQSISQQCENILKEKVSIS
jgi:molecular chaperone GrpE (heat shock protein)